MASVKELTISGAHGSRSPGPLDHGVIESFSHLVLEVSDRERSERWYESIMGVEVLGRGLLSEPNPHSLLRLNTRQLLVLLEVQTPKPRRHNSSSIHDAFSSA